MLQRSAVKLSFPAAHVPDVRTRSGRLWFCETCLSTTESVLLLLGGLENLERAQQALVDAHHGTGIVEFAAVVRSGEQGDELALREEFVAVLDDLMRAADQIHIVFLQEAGHNVRAECEGDTTIVLAPSSNILVRVGPQKVAEKTAVGDVRWSHNAADLLHGVEIGAQTTVHSEDLLVDDRSDRKAVEAVGECLPQLDVVAPLALVIETIDTVDRRALVVAAQDEEVLRIFDLVCEQQADGLEGLLSSVNIVAQEKIVGLRWESAIFEETQKIVILSVDVTANLYGRLQLKEDWL